MSFYRYDLTADVHVLDCGGTVSLEIGIARLRVLARELRARPPRDGIAKLLIDFRNTVFEDENAHMELSRLTRTEFGLNPSNEGIRAAIVHTRARGQGSGNERWFRSDADAMRWLCSGSSKKEPASAHVWGSMVWLAGSEVGNAKDISVARMQMLPGGEAPGHRHPNCEEVIVVVRGSVEIRVVGEVFRRASGQCAVVPEGAAHSVANIGPDEAELILTYSTGARVYEPC